MVDRVNRKDQHLRVVALSDGGAGGAGLGDVLLYSMVLNYRGNLIGIDPPAVAQSACQKEILNQGSFPLELFEALFGFLPFSFSFPHPFNPLLVSLSSNISHRVIPTARLSSRCTLLSVAANRQ